MRVAEDAGGFLLVNSVGRGGGGIDIGEFCCIGAGGRDCVVGSLDLSLWEILTDSLLCRPSVFPTSSKVNDGVGGPFFDFCSWDMDAACRQKGAFVISSRIPRFTRDMVVLSPISMLSLSSATCLASFDA